MFARIKALLAPPVFPDREKTRKARLLNTVLIGGFVLLGILSLARLFLAEQQWSSGEVTILAGFASVLVILFIGIRRGFVELAANILVGITWLSIALLSWRADGVQDSGMLAYFVAILIASLLSGWRLAIFITGLTVVAGWGFVYLESLGQIIPSPDASIDLMTDYSFFFAVGGILAFLVADGLQKTLAEVKENNRSLQQLRQQLEQRVQERTRELAVVAEVGQRISHVQDLDNLLVESVELIREQFDLYHVQIYLADAEGQNLNLRASAGSIGRQLLSRGHRLPIQQGSINGAAAFDKKPVLVPDTATDPLFRPNPLLPLTRSEMAVPLMVGEQLLGVLDMQSDQAGAFSSENQSTYSSLADQLAIAVDNAYLLRQTEQDRQKVERYVQITTHEGWSNYLDGIDQKERIGVRYDLNDLEEYDGPVVAEPGDQVLQVPITVANATIGTIQLEAGEDQEWTEDTRALVTAVAEQVGKQAENLRLFTEADRYRTESEKAALRLSGRIWHKQVSKAKADERLEGFVYTRNQVAPLAGDSLDDAATSSSIQYPLIIQNETIGEFVVSGTDEDEAHVLLAAVANQLNRHLESIRLAEQTESALGQTESLYQIGHQLNTAANVDEILHAALGPIFPTGIDEATLMFIELNRLGEPQTLELLAGWRLDGKLSFPVGTIFPMERFPFTRLFINEPDDPQLIGDAATDPRVDDFTRGVMAHAGIKAIAVIPLTMGAQWVGIITCSWPQPHVFSKQEEEIFSALIHMAAPTVQSQRLYFKTKELAEKEHLINQINEQILNSDSIESAMQTAVNELGQALQSTTQVKLSNLKEKI